MILELDEAQATAIFNAVVAAAAKAAADKHLADAAAAADLVAEIAAQMGEEKRAADWIAAAERMRVAQQVHEDRRAVAEAETTWRPSGRRTDDPPETA